HGPHTAPKSPLSLHDALPISPASTERSAARWKRSRSLAARLIVRLLARRRLDVNHRVLDLRETRHQTILHHVRDAMGVGEAHLRSEGHTSELQSREKIVCRLL